ncbi:MAG: hypothetical protein HGA90_01175 [Alphaproteobacteria bacterium]|nr:hypothetical protein [Alphaproteobacteria bacterium]
MKFLQDLRNRLQSLTYGNRFYRLMLEKGPVPERLRLNLSDLWPGDAEAAQALIAGPPNLFEHEAPTTTAKGKQLLAHDWLRDLRAMGTESARRKARTLLEDWLENHDEWREDSWECDVLGERLTNWVCFHDFYSPGASADFTRRLRASMVRQLRHLIRTVPVTLTGEECLSSIKGLVFAGLSLLDSEKALSLALDMLQRLLATEVLTDGGPVARCPSRQLHALRAFIDIRMALRAAQMEIPHELTMAIGRMVPALKLFRHGDGGLALFHGGVEESSLMIEAALTLSEARGRVLRRLTQTGYERVAAGRSLLLVDVGVPPASPYDTVAHAGMLSFEFSVGRERLIVNCGAGPEGDPDWRQAMAATAAHSTLTVEDTNACEVLHAGGLGHRPKEVATQRYEQAGVHYVEAAHDGYVGKYRLLHHRTLGLAAEGEELRGREVLSGPPGRAFVLRWHLHPSVQASLLQGGQAVLLRLPSGGGWRLRMEGSELANDLGLEASIYCGGGAPRRTLQIKASGYTRDNPTVIGWSLTRAKK